MHLDELYKMVYLVSQFWIGHLIRQRPLKRPFLMLKTIDSGGTPTFSIRMDMSKLTFVHSLWINHVIH